MIDDSILDDAARLRAADSGDMLAAVASSGAQMRNAVHSVDRDEILRVASEGTPRSFVVAGMGGSGVSGDIIAAVAGPSCSVPLVVVRTHRLPGWVNPLDAVIAVSCSGRTEETLEVASEASRRGARLVTVGAANSPLAEISAATKGAHHIEVDAQGRMPRASLWALVTPMLVLADALGICEVGTRDFDAAADIMDELSVECGPANPFDMNPAKLLGAGLGESLPVVWGTGGIGTAVAGRFMAQLAENAKLPSVSGALPEVGHNQIVTFDGPFAGEHDLFDDEIKRRLHLVLLRDDAEHPGVTKRVEVIEQMTAKRALRTTELVSRGEHRLTRTASLVVPTDWASVYAAFALGIDPSPIEPIAQLKSGVAGA